MQSGKAWAKPENGSTLILLKGFVLLIKIRAIFCSNPAVSTVHTQPVVICYYYVENYMGSSFISFA